MSFENIVRPFQLPNSQPPRQYVTPRQQSQPPVVLYLGRSGSGRVFGGSYSAQWTRYQRQIVAEDVRAYIEIDGGNFGFKAPEYHAPTIIGV